MKKVMIVFEETLDEELMTKEKRPGFKVYMAGDVERLGKTDSKDLSAAEFWGLNCFRIVGEAIKKAGQVKYERKAPLSAVAEAPPAPTPETPA